MRRKNTPFKKRFVTTRTPLRISLTGGGTDMPYYYNKFGGITLSSTIDKYLYVTVKAHNNFREKYRLNYYETEILNKVDKIKNLRIKETLKFFKIKEPLYISTVSDIPHNTGLGSSSSFVVGLVKAIISLMNKTISEKKLAEVAFRIENRVANYSLGKQDHYIASYGGINLIRYNKKGVIVKKISIGKKNEKFLSENLLFIYTGKSRSANTHLTSQKKNFGQNIIGLNKLKQCTKKMLFELNQKKLNLIEIGKILEESWNIKKNLTNKITDGFLDKIYSQAKKSGCYGGKLLGAGGGGFFIFVCKKQNHSKVIRNLKKYKNIEFSFNKSGSQLILQD